MTPADPPADRAPGAPECPGRWTWTTRRDEGLCDACGQWVPLRPNIAGHELRPHVAQQPAPCGISINTTCQACGGSLMANGGLHFCEPPAPPSADAGAMDREQLGRLVRQVWVDYCRRTGDNKPSHIAPWEDLSEYDREADRLIGEAVWTAAQQQHAAEVEQWRRESFAAAASLHAEIARLTADLQAAQQALARYRHPVEDMPEAARYGTTYPEWRAEKELQINGRLTKREGLLTASAWEVGESRMAQRLRAAVERVEADLQAAQQRADGLRELLRLYAIKTDHLADGWAMCLVCEGPAFSMGFPEQHKPECPLATPPTPTGDRTKHAPSIPGETNVKHASHCLRCQEDARRGPVALRDTPTGDPAAADDAGARRERLERLDRRAGKEPIGVDVSDMGDEWVEGFLAGQANVLAYVLSGQIDNEPLGHAPEQMLPVQGCYCEDCRRTRREQRAAHQEPA